MNETLQVLKTRRSTKAYTDQPIPDELLDQILEAGIYAPSGRNSQKAIIVLVRDKETRDQLSRLNGSFLGAAGLSPSADPFYGAPCVAVVLADPQRDTWVEDGSLVLGNMMTAAHALGVGSCWVHRAREMFDSDEGRALLEKWGLPTYLRGVGNCLLGYPAQTPAEKPRVPGRIVKID